MPPLPKKPPNYTKRWCDRCGVGYPSTAACCPVCKNPGFSLAPVLQSQAMPLKQLAERLERIRCELAILTKELGEVTFQLYTRGVADKGPVRETNQDCPF